ncbi:hypothetical protein EN866_33215 [Mesorhizobium sp. M2D.F.Ca.ET.223.01.1.1]|uniref:hypothetical protein n=1 Tax=Mesorhizobium sp. M2D.F.Ca.ET.223.01.1.1 TaxID=2563940 RepID=UPI0010922A2A|nr:hypothetical protein [Mesorhizobium sp. M2D.F.Ca.ET.223.01.1.1]TGR84549.1 hypothetical protein EN866_33215 [Mesorhizobium sp. M2D.F.Ca.ET.223.01.1.1]TGT78427.1 hypothetical protein EN802_01940 [bacterium M00.F.Ca.ET.159.01.1.1]TGT89094.1 hypothetical protein EN800_01940 [bacterium M00.F.Ca.ET.157.01.1.1]
MRKLALAGLGFGALLCGAVSDSHVSAMGKMPPPDAVAQQLAEYRGVLVAYFKAFNLLPIVFPAGQKPGDVFDMRQKGVLKSTAEECFPGLVQPAPVPSALAYTFQLDSSKAGFALGLATIGSVDIGGDFEQMATVSFTDVKVVSVSQQSLSTYVSNSCKEVAAVVAQSEVPFQPASPPPLLAVIGTLVSAKRQIFIGTKQNLDVKASVDKLSTVLATTGVGATLKVTGLDPSLSVALGFGGKRGVLVQSDQELPVAFMPAFIPEILFSTVQGDNSGPAKPRSLAWQSFDPAAPKSTQVLNSLVDAVANK